MTCKVLYSAIVLSDFETSRSFATGRVMCVTQNMNRHSYSFDPHGNSTSWATGSWTLNFWFSGQVELQDSWMMSTL